MKKNKRRVIPFSFLCFLQILIFQVTNAQTAAFKGKIGKTFADSKEYWADPVKAPEGAPNVVWILLDDVGYGAAGTFGGLINTPTFDSLANNGLKYTNFHTAAICAPSRACLLTGRNQHAVHEGGFSHIKQSAGFPGYDGRIPSSAGTIAEILRENGYNTFAVGKYGITPEEDYTDAGPFDYWPTGKGFERFLGFLGSFTDQYAPNLVEDQTHVKPDGRHFSELITNKSIEYISKQKKAAPNKPFFLYYAPAATHSPHQVDTFWSNKYKGKFDEGWDVYREKVLANQIKLGVVPADAILPERNSDIKPWKSLSDKEKKLYARFMEVYAGFLEYTDHEVNRIVNYLKSIQQLDNTIFFVMIGDNGASKEGTFTGHLGQKLLERITSTKTEAQVVDEFYTAMNTIGQPTGYEANYPLGWAQATNTPFKYWKQDANAEGSCHNPLIISYPKGIKDKGGIRNQYSHLIDIMPTTLDCIGIKLPKKIKGIQQDPIHGTSLVYTFDNAKAPSKHTLQYYYIFGSRAIYKDGWKAGVGHHPDFGDYLNAGLNGKAPAKTDYNKDVWELYNLNTDFNERIDLSKKYPQKLKELQELFHQQAIKNHIYPLLDWEDVMMERLHKNKIKK